MSVKTGIMIVLHPPCNYLLLYQHCPNCLSVNLQDFFDPAFSNYKRIWSLTEVPKLTKFVGCLKDVKKEETVLKVVKEFDEYVMSNYSKLKKGTHSVLCDWFT